MKLKIYCDVCNSDKIIEMTVDTFEDAKIKFDRDGLGDLLDHGSCRSAWKLDEIRGEHTSGEDPRYSESIGTRNVFDNGTEEDSSSRIGLVKKASGSVEGNK